MRAVAAGSVLVLLLGICPLGCSSEPEIDGKKVTDWIALLRSEDWTMRDKAQETLARLGKDAVPYLKRLVRGTDPTMRRSVVITLEKIGPPAAEIVPALLRRMKVEKVAVIRAAILRALAAIAPRAPGVPEEFEKRLRDVDAEVRDAAKAGLELLAKPDKQPEPAEREEAADEVAADKKKDELVLRDAVAAELGKQGVSFGLVAEVVRASRRAAVVWPALKDGKILDDDIVAYVFEQRGKDGWELVAGNLGLSGGKGANKLAEALGGADQQRVVRPCGVPRAGLAGYLQQKAEAFHQAVEAGRPAEAMSAYEQLSRAFSFRKVAYDDMLPEMLIKKAFVDSPWKFEPSDDADTCPVEVQTKEGVRKGTLHFAACGGATVISDLEADK